MADARSPFAARLRELRELAGLSQKELAERSGLSQRAVSHWEQGLREPMWSNVLALAAALGVPITAFLEPPAAPRLTPRRGRPRRDRTRE
ncbi:MAG TPA: helix-turn-helix transcriptional regulator [Gemmataceae bacterium]